MITIDEFGLVVILAVPVVVSEVLIESESFLGESIERHDAG